MKDFLLIANTNACTYKEFFPLLKERKVSMGVEMPKEYDMPDGTTKKFGNICWYTTLPTPNKKKLVLTKRYHHELYPHYDNYNAIEVSRIKDIPWDYECVMGVPITIFQYDLDNVEVLWTASGHTKNTMPKDIANRLSADFEMKSKSGTGNGYAILNGNQLYHRILIKKKIVIMGDKTINGKDTHINGKEKYRRVCIRFTRK